MVNKNNISKNLYKEYGFNTKKAALAYIKQNNILSNRHEADEDFLDRVVAHRNIQPQQIQPQQNNLIFQMRIPRRQLHNTSYIYNTIRNNMNRLGNHFNVSITGQNTLSRDVNIKKGLSKWWKNGSNKSGPGYQIFNFSDNTMYGDWDGPVTLTLSKIVPVVRKQYAQQAYRDIPLGECKMVLTSKPNENKQKQVKSNKIHFVKRDNPIEHCVLGPIKKFIEFKLYIAKTKNTKKKWRKLLNYINEMIEKFDAGISATELQDVCNKVRINISIQDILLNNYQDITCTSSKKIEKTIKFINTRMNHVEECNLLNDEDCISLTKEDMKDIILQLKQNKEFFVYTGHIDCPNFIYTRTKKYKIENMINVAISKFERDIGLDKLKIDYFENKELSKYLLEACHIPDFNMFNKELQNKINSLKLFDKELLNKKIIQEFDFKVKEMDLKKAYTQHEQSEFYCGFPSVINHIQKLNIENNKEFLEKYNGIYTIENISFDNVNENIKKILHQYGYNKSALTMSNPDLLMLLKYGVTFTITRGAFSSKKITNMQYTSGMIDKKAYAIFAGKLMSVNSTKRFNTLYYDEEFASVLTSSYSNVYTNDYFKQITIEQENKHNYFAPHIASFIFSYCRCNVIEQLVKMNFEDIIGVKLDSIIFRGEYEFNNLWNEKQVNFMAGWCDNHFDRKIREYNIFNVSPEFTGNEYKFNDSILLGAGGTGKTHSILGNKSNNNILFVSFAWRLVTEMMNKYNVKGVVVQHLVGEGVQCYLDNNKHPGIIVIDECTMISKNYINKCIELYPYSQIILMGDLDKNGNPYQCTVQNLQTIVPKKYKFDLFEYTKDYRAKDCKKLQKIKRDLRLITKQYYEGKYNLQQAINKQLQYIRKNMKNRIIDEIDLVDEYDSEKHNIISSAKYRCSEINTLMTGNDKKDKFRINNHNIQNLYKKLSGDKTVLLNGEFTFENGSNREIAHCNTIHSFQGMTVNDNIYISAQCIKGINNLYTAISRATNINNIYIFDLKQFN
jgi:uncharacterized protein YlxP (DUF503 family)